MPETTDHTRLRALLDEATPGPWRWGKDWARVDRGGLPYEDSERSPGRDEKYMDLGLYDARGDAILNLRVDHYEPEWDTGVEVGTVDLPKPIRDLITAAVNALPSLLAEVEALRAVRDAAEALEPVLRPFTCDGQSLWTADLDEAWDALEDALSRAKEAR